jgi:hypothetical protein
MNIRLLASLALVLIWFGLASAHEYQYHGDVSVLLHSDPDDNPWAGEPARMYFFFKNLSAETCDCVVRIFEGEKKIGEEKPGVLSDESYGSNVLYVDHAFPHLGVYRVNLVAQPEGGAPFEFNYTMRIERDRRSWMEQNAGIVKTAGLVTLLGIVILTVLWRKRHIRA